jgi:hypothetical protein
VLFNMREKHLKFFSLCLSCFGLVSCVLSNMWLRGVHEFSAFASLVRLGRRTCLLPLCERVLLNGVLC